MMGRGSQKRVGLGFTLQLSNDEIYRPTFFSPPGRELTADLRGSFQPDKIHVIERLPRARLKRE